MALGPRPEGDPAAMRALAAQIDAVAGSLHRSRPVRLENWQSDRAVQAKATISSAVASIDIAGDQLRLAARYLAREAGECEREQRAWDRRKDAQDAERIERDRARAEREGGEVPHVVRGRV